MKRVKPYVLLSTICLCALGMTVIGFHFENTIYSDKQFNWFKDPPIEAFMMSIHDETYFSEFTTKSAVCFGKVALNCFKEHPLPALALTDTSTWDELKFEKVNEFYFKDAVFIGDSRTVGIEYYAGFKYATFYAATSLNIFDYDSRRIPIDGTKQTVKDALSKNQFKKIYLMVGINDVAVTTSSTFYDTYKSVIEDIQSLQPDAIIFIEGNLHVTKQKSDNDKIFNNKKIEEFNQKIATLADQKKVFYIDVNESTLCDKSGYLIGEYTWDQIHLQAQYYPIWKEYIMSKGIKIKEKKDTKKRL